MLERELVLSAATRHDLGRGGLRYQRRAVRTSVNCRGHDFKVDALSIVVDGVGPGYYTTGLCPVEHLLEIYCRVE